MVVHRSKDQEDPSSNLHLELGLFLSLSFSIAGSSRRFNTTDLPPKMNTQLCSWWQKLNLEGREWDLKNTIPFSKLKFHDFSAKKHFDDICLYCANYANQVTSQTKAPKLDQLTGSD